MADLPSREELFRRGRAAAIAVPNTRISPRVIDQEGTDANLLIAAGALMAEEVAKRSARAIGGCFESTAEKDALDRVIFDRKRLPRKPAAPAVGVVSLQRPTFAAGAGTIDGNLPGGDPAPTRIRTNSGIVYLLLEPAYFGATDLGPIQVRAQAELAGLAYEVEENQEWSFLDVIFDESITVTNAEAMAGGADEELDDAYRARSANFWQAIRRGTLGAIEFALRSTPGIETVSVIEVTTPDGIPAFIAQAFILDALGRANQTLAFRGLLTLLEYRSLGVPVQIFNGVPDYINIRIRPSFNSSIVNDTVDATNRMRAAIVAALNTQVSGQLLYRSTIIAAARTIPGLLLEDTDLIEPVGTLVPDTPDIVFRTKAELITTS